VLFEIDPRRIGGVGQAQSQLARDQASLEMPSAI